MKRYPLSVITHTSVFVRFFLRLLSLWVISAPVIVFCSGSLISRHLPFFLVVPALSRRIRRPVVARPPNDPSTPKFLVTTLARSSDCSSAFERMKLPGRRFSPHPLESKTFSLLSVSVSIFFPPMSPINLFPLCVSGRLSLCRP